MSKGIPIRDKKNDSLKETILSMPMPLLSLNNINFRASSPTGTYYYYFLMINY